MWDKQNKTPHTSHTTNKVPLILISSKNNKSFTNINLKDGKLSDIAPTILNIMGITIPAEMTGDILLK